MFCVVFVIISKWGCSLLRYEINAREVVRVIDKFGSPPNCAGGSFQSSAQCLALRSPILHLFVWPVIWLSMMADQAEGSLMIL